MIGPNSSSTISGNLGAFLQHGVTPKCIEKQLERMVKTEIKFNTHGDYLKLKDEFDYIVIATGTESAAKELGCFQELFNAVVYGAVILGEFEVDTLIAWFNTKYAKSGYAYRTPFNEKRAALVMIIPNIKKDQVYDYWNAFINGENIKNEIVQTFMTEHRSGFVYPHRINNIFLTGLAGGCIDPFLGFGSVYSIVTGVAAARSIALGLDYEQQIQKFAQRNKEIYEYRIALNSMDNGKLNLMVKGLGAPIIRNVIYNTHINFPKYGSNANYALRRIERRIYRAKASYYLLKNTMRRQRKS